MGGQAEAKQCFTSKGDMSLVRKCQSMTCNRDQALIGRHQGVTCSLIGSGKEMPARDLQSNWHWGSLGLCDFAAWMPRTRFY